MINDGPQPGMYLGHVAPGDPMDDVLECPRCGGETINEEGFCEGPREYHTECWYTEVAEAEAAELGDAEHMDAS